MVQSPSEAEKRRPRAVLRVGLIGGGPMTGDGDVGRLRGAASEVLRVVATIVAEVGRDPAYAAGVPPLLAVISTLAENSDRALFAAAVGADLPLTVERRVVLPAAREHCGLTHGATDEEFQSLLAQADGGVVELNGELDPVTGCPDDAGHKTAAQFVAFNSDLLIAIVNADGTVGEGVRFAAKQGMPVWLIDAADVARVRLVRSQREFDESAGVAAEAAWERLRSAIGEILSGPHGEVLPRPRRPDPGLMTVLSRIGTFVRESGRMARSIVVQPKRTDRQIYEALLAERDPPRWLMKLARFHRMLRSVILIGNEQSEGTWREEVDGPHVFAHYRRFYRIVDGPASYYAHLYRTAWCIVLLFGFVAITCAIVLLYMLGRSPLHLPAWLGVVELVALGITGYVLLANRYWRWHDRWIDYRMLAEFLRHQSYASLLGRSLPLRRLEALARHGGLGDRRGWVPWYISAVIRSTPWLASKIDPGRVRDVRDRVADYLRGQVEYHEGRAHNSHVIAGRLGWFSAAVFGATFLVVLTKVGWHHFVHSDKPPHALEQIALWSAAIAPVFAATLFAYRAYGEFEVLHKVSSIVERQLRPRLKELGEDYFVVGTFASQRLSTELSSLAALMLAELEDWAQLFDVKAVEA